MENESKTKPELRIILIDDNPFDTELIQMALQAELDYNVVVAMERQGFLAELEHEPPDVIISDSNVPGFDCMAALDLVRKKYPRVPFVFCSGSASEELRALALERGAKAWVSKNDLRRLVTVVKRVCSVTGE